MIGISKLYCGTVEPSDALRYGRHSSRLPSHLLQFSEDKRPVVVWNVTRRCNLKCVHCYAHAEDKSFANELSTSQGRDLIEDRAVFQHYLYQANIPDQFAEAGVAYEEDVYIAFSPSHPHAAEYAGILSAAIVELRTSGKLDTILRKYGLHDWVP